jgi:hypothetical protein
VVRSPVLPVFDPKESKRKSSRLFGVSYTQQKSREHYCFFSFGLKTGVAAGGYSPKMRFFTVKQLKNILTTLYF